MSQIINDLVWAVTEDNVYSLLPPGDFIRYLVLKPGQDNDPLECTLHTSHLNSMPYFEAVSYVWGAPHRHHSIKCNGQNLYITANLRIALRRLRLLTENRTLWVDSICIDQKNSTEKSHQVAFMCQIYTRADRVLICLGPDDENHGPKAASLITDMNLMIERVFQEINFSSGSFPYLEEENLNRVASDTRWESVFSMQHDPWFLRGWVIQEAGLAKDALLLWGSAEIKWLPFIRVYSWLNMRALQILYSHKLRMSSIHFDIYLNKHQQEARALVGDILDNHALSMLRVLHKGRSTTFYDPRDRVYAFQALVDDASGKDFVLAPDYDKPYLAVYCDLATQYIEICKDLDLLNYVQHTAHTIEQEASSWVPRWNVWHGSTEIMRSHCPKLQSRDLEKAIPVVTAEKALKGRGIVFDSVVFKSSEFTFKISVVEIASIWRFLLESGIKSTYSPFRRLLAFVETLCVGKILGDSGKWKAHRAAYILLLNRISCGNSGINQVDVTAFLDEAGGGDAECFHRVVQTCVHGRRFFVTERGYYGLGSHITSQSDLCCILFGGKTPFIIRKTGMDDEYKLVGESWLTSKLVTFQNGREKMSMLGREQCKDWLDWDITERDISLV